MVPTNVAPLARLLAYAESLGLEWHWERPKRGVSTLALSLLWLDLAWRGSGRPHHLSQLTEPLLPALLGCPALPTARTLSRSLASFPAKGAREAVEAAYQAELPRRSGRVWVAIDAHQLPFWGRGQKQRFQYGRRAGRVRTGGACGAIDCPWPWTPTPVRSSPIWWRGAG